MNITITWFERAIWDFDGPQKSPRSWLSARREAEGRQSWPRAFPREVKTPYRPILIRLLLLLPLCRERQPPPHTHLHTYFFTPAVAAFNVLFGIALVSIDAVPLRLTQKIRNSCCCFVFLMITHSFVYLITESYDVKCSAFDTLPKQLNQKNQKYFWK